MMCKLILFFCILPCVSIGQCLSGDCKNGEGKFDFGFAVYEGSFKDSKPHGKGTMDYGSGDKYIGAFANGKEEGDGILYNATGFKAVRYKNGVMQVRNEPVIIGGNDAYITDIICEGNCKDGHGTIRFPSGNEYNGEFRGGKFYGKGKMKFASGNILEGEFIDHLPVRGTFTYASDGTVFSGSFNADGTPATGTYTSKQTGGVVQVSGGTITKVSNPRIDSVRASQPRYEEQRCNACRGAGFTVMTTTKYEQLTPNVYQASSTGYASLIRTGQSLKTTHSSQLKCKACNGSGSISKQIKN